MTSEQVVESLKNNIDIKTTYFNKTWPTDKDYEGYFTAKNKFLINRMTTIRNSFLPNVIGTIENDLCGAKIHIKMKLHPVTQGVFLTMLFVCSLFVLVVILRRGMPNNLDDNFYIPIGSLLFVYSFGLISFKYESQRAKGFLKAVFESDVK